MELENKDKEILNKIIQILILIDKKYKSSIHSIVQTPDGFYRLDFKFCTGLNDFLDKED